MYPISNEVKALFESEQKQILRITGGEKSPISKSVGPSAMASFSDAIAADALNLSVDISPVQSGSGDPSPTNVRPISGWTGANVTRTGVNVWDEQWEVGTINTNTGEAVTNRNHFRTKDFVRVNPLTAYYVATGSNTVFILQYGYDKVTYYGYTRVSNQTLTTYANAKYIKFVVTNTNTYNNDISVNFPSTYAEYIPSRSETHPISWQSEAGTVYGGTLDVTTGLLTVTMAEVDLGTLTWVYLESNKLFSTNISGKKPGIAGGAVSQYVNGGWWSGWADKDCVWCGNAANAGFVVKDTRFADAATFKSAMSGVQLVYELATPITYQLTPTQIALLAGMNNVWADCGDMTVEYATGYEYEINITDANVMMNGFEIDRFCSAGSKLEIGNAIASELSLKLDNRQCQFNDIVFEGAELFVEVGIADWTQASPTVNWIPCGYFTCDEQPRTLSTITIKALDRMLKFDREPIEMSIPWTNENGVPFEDGRGNIIYFVYNLAFPITVAQMVKLIAEGCGVPFTQDLSVFPNHGYTITSIPSIQQTITCRMLLQWCAGIMGTNAWIDWNGNLRFSWYDNATDYVTTTANRLSSDLFEDDITITGFTYTNSQNITIFFGSLDYTLDLTGNYLAATGISAILSNLNDALSDFSYRPFKAEIINAPYLWPMDVITFNKDGVDHSCVLTNVNFGINRTMSLEGKGETAEVNKGIAPSGMTKEQAFIFDKFNASLDQESVFNRLTENGAAQGLYLYDGNFYLNASYIKGGTIDGESVNAKLFRVVDNDNNTIASFNDTITIGQESAAYMQMDYRSFNLFDSDGDNFLSFGDARGTDGLALCTDTFIANGATSVYNASAQVVSIISVLVDGTPPTSYRYDPAPGDYGWFVISPLSAKGSLVEVTYKTNMSITHYDLGYRAPNTSQGNLSVIEGRNNTASGALSHAEGNNTSALAQGSHSEGHNTQAKGEYCHAEGEYSQATGDACHAEGYGTMSGGVGSHAEGERTSAQSVASHAEGIETVANHVAQHVFGIKNVIPSTGDYVEIVGGGNQISANRVNIRTLSWAGNEWIAGTLTQASDQRLKDECGEVPDVSGIKARMFKWNDNKLRHDDKVHLGYFAQDVEKVAPYLVSEDEMGYKSLDYIGFLVAKVASLEKRVAELEAKEGITHDN